MASTTRNRWAALAALLLAPALLVACGGGSTDAGAPLPPQAEDAAGPPTSEVVDANREVIRNASMLLQVDDVPATADRVSALAAERGGRTSSANIGATDEDPYANIVVRVPAADLDDYLDDVSALGTVESLQVSAEDVTAQAVDLDARIAAIQTSVDRLTELLGQADTTKDLIEIERELSARQAELDSLRAQRASLSELVALSTVTIDLIPTPSAEAFVAPGFVSGLESGWAAVVSVAGIAITVLGFAAPFVVLLLIIGVPLAALLVWLRRRGRPGQPPQA